jgi:hypothetical protein
LEVFMIAVLTESRKIDVAREPDTVGAMPRTASALGICVTCNYVGICTGRASWVGPVFHCEEFDDRAPVTQGEPPTPDLTEEAVSAATHATARFGLCVNCEHQEICGFRGQESGVWHCEEYE